LTILVHSCRHQRAGGGSTGAQWSKLLGSQGFTCDQKIDAGLKVRAPLLPTAENGLRSAAAWCNRVHRRRGERYLLHGIDAGQAGGDQGMAHLVIGDPSPLLLVEHPALLFDPGHDAFDGNGKIVEGNLFAISPGRCDRSLIDQIGNNSASRSLAKSGTEIHREPGLSADQKNQFAAKMAGFAYPVRGHGFAEPISCHFRRADGP